MSTADPIFTFSFSLPILKSHDSNAPELVDFSDPLKQIGACEFLAEQLCHIPPPDRLEGLSRQNYIFGRPFVYHYLKIVHNYTSLLVRKSDLLNDLYPFSIYRGYAHAYGD